MFIVISETCVHIFLDTSLRGSFQERKKVLEIKPYIVDEMDCDSCLRGLTRLGVPPVAEGPRSPALLYCPHLTCLSYLCIACFIRLHPLSDPELASHRPLSKDPKIKIDG